MNKLVIGLIIGLIVGLAAGGFGGYLLFGKMNKPNQNFMRNTNFQLDESAKQQTALFFNSTEDINEISSYCQQNRANCFYYCREINPQHKICSEPSIPNTLNRRGNFSGGRQ